MTSLPVVTLDERIDTLTKATLEREQAECPVTHKFYPGMYVREMTVGPGVLVIGHYHKTSHYNRMVTGRALFVKDDGTVVEKIAPWLFVSKPGRKVAYVLEEMIFQNIFDTDETDMEKLEAELFAQSDIWDEHVKKQQLLLTHDHSVDVEDFKLAMKEHNLDLDWVRQVSEYPEDQIAFPHGNYKAVVANSNIEGKGLFASGNIVEGEVIAPARLNDKRTPAGRYTNHSKTPNAFFVLRENNDIDLVALRLITGARGGSLGEEITIDYRQALGLYKEKLICPQQSQHQSLV